MKVQIVLIAALVFCCSSVVESGNLGSTLNIVGHLCLIPSNRNSQSVIDAFFGCYDQAPGKDLFVQCQVQTFGGAMNTVENVGTTCNRPLLLPRYADCLSKAFTAAGIDMDSTVATINECQSGVLGI